MGLSNPHLSSTPGLIPHPSVKNPGVSVTEIGAERNHTPGEQEPNRLGMPIYPVGILETATMRPANKNALAVTGTLVKNLEPFLKFQQHRLKLDVL